MQKKTQGFNCAPSHSLERPRRESAGHSGAVCPDLTLTPQKIWIRQAFFSTWTGINFKINWACFFRPWSILKNVTQTHTTSEPRHSHRTRKYWWTEEVSLLSAQLCMTLQTLRGFYPSAFPKILLTRGRAANKPTTLQKGLVPLKKKKKKSSRPRCTILKAPSGKEQHTGLCPFLTSNVIHYCHATVSLGMTLFAAKISARMMKDHGACRGEVASGSRSSGLTFPRTHSDGTDADPHACAHTTYWPDRCITLHRSCVWWAASRGMGQSAAAAYSPKRLSLYSHIFSSVASSSSLLLHCMREYLSLAGGKQARFELQWGRLFSPADVFEIVHRLTGQIHFTSSSQLEVTCGGGALHLHLR